MKRSLLFSLHSVSGLLAGLFVLVMSLSGSALVFREEIDQLQWPAVTAGAGNQLTGVDTCYARLQEHFPRIRISNCLLPGSPTQPYLFAVYDSAYYSGSRPRQLFLHPQTAAVIGERGGSKDVKGNTMAWLAAFHNSFHAGKTGEWLLGFFALLFVFSLVTGFILYRRNIIPTLLFRRRMFRAANFHQLIGVYALLFNLVIAFSGFWMQRYVFKPSFYKSLPPLHAEWKASPAPVFSIDSAIGVVQKKYPSFTPAVIYFAQSPSGNTSVYGSRSTNSFIHSKKYADRITLDSAGSISATAFVTDIAAADRYDIVNAQVHYGRYGGKPVQLLYSLFGLSGAGLSITGFILWLKKRKRKR